MISKEAVLEACLHDNPAARGAFLKKHGTRAKRVALQLAAFYPELEQALAAWPKNDRTRTVGQFLHIAGNSLVQSLNLLVLGMGVPSGNLMRQYLEAIAMAMLCSVKRGGTLESYLVSQKTYPIHKAVDRVVRKEPSSALTRELGFDARTWERFRASMRLFDLHSHSTFLALGYHIRFGKLRGGIIIGSEYDSQKFKVYRRELGYRLAAAQHLNTLLNALRPHLS